MRIAKTLLHHAPPRPPSPARPDPARADLVRMHALIVAGRAEDAMQVAIASLDDGHGAPLLELARYCAQHGRSSLALELLAIVGGVRPDLLVPLAGERAFAALADDPRFVQMTGGL
jgi:hypothetical protein